jgi:hypothetical protein
VIFVLQIFQILMWAGSWKCFPSGEPAFYFSTSSYSTVGYGDLVLPRMWRALGPVESVTGVLMCGLSVSLLFAIVTFLVRRAGLFPTEGVESGRRASTRAGTLNPEGVDREEKQEN